MPALKFSQGLLIDRATDQVDFLQTFHLPQRSQPRAGDLGLRQMQRLELRKMLADLAATETAAFAKVAAQAKAALPAPANA